MEHKIDLFFKMTLFVMLTMAAFPHKKPLRSQLKTFMLYKIWPVMFVTTWGCMVPMVLLKLAQFIQNNDWERVLDAIHMFFVGFYTLFAIATTQLSASLYKYIIDSIQSSFKAGRSLTVNDLYPIIIMWLGFCLAYILYIGSCIYNGEVLVPVWVPFIDNEVELRSGAFWFVWIYQSGAAYCILCCLAILGPFLIVASTCIGKELDYLKHKIEEIASPQVGSPQRNRHNMYRKNADFKNKKHDYEMPMNYSDEATRMFLKDFIEHHLTVQRTLKAVSAIHNPFFLAQTSLTVIHSCFLTFNIIYTSQLGKVLIKSSPILFLSYFIMFIYCWNGQQLTDKCEELYRAMYRCPWYFCSRSFRQSILLMMEMNKRPVQLSGFGIFAADLGLFLKCVQQSISYIMLLSTLSSK